MKFLIAVLALFSATQAHAVSLAVEPFDNLIHAAPIIVRGTVSGVTHKSGSFPMTCHRVTVTERLKGAPASVVKVCQPGGKTSDGQVMFGEGADLDVGEDVVLLLSARHADGTYSVHGASAGKLKVQPDETVTGEGPNIDRAHGKHSRAWKLEDVRAAAR